jgi:putative transposase
MAAKTYQPAGCDTDLSDAEWELLKPLIYPADAKRGRGRWRDPDSARACLDAIRYVLKTGCQWSLLPRDFPSKSTVHDALARWTQQGLWPRINEALCTRTRLMLKNSTSAAVIDSQSVKGGQLLPLSCGYDAGKKIKGRKRHVLTGTNGLLLGAVVTPASVQDRDGAKLLLRMFCHSSMSLLMIFADGSYAGKLEEFVQRMGRLFGHGTSVGLGIIKNSQTRRASSCCPDAGLSNAASAGW